MILAHGRTRGALPVQVEAILPANCIGLVASTHNLTHDSVFPSRDMNKTNSVVI